VDGTYGMPAEGSGAGERVYQPRTQDELDKLAAIVKSAVGFNSQRSDQVEFFNVPFDRQELQIEQEQLDTMYQRDFYWDIAKKVGLVLLALLAFFYLKRKTKKLFRALGGLLPAPRPQMESMELAAIQEEEVRPLPVEKRKPRLTDQMQLTAKERPEEVARVIKTLMVE